MKTTTVTKEVLIKIHFIMIFPEFYQLLKVVDLRGFMILKMKDSEFLLLWMMEVLMIEKVIYNLIDWNNFGVKCDEVELIYQTKMSLYDSLTSHSIKSIANLQFSLIIPRTRKCNLHRISLVGC